MDSQPHTYAEDSSASDRPRILPNWPPCWTVAELSQAGEQVALGQLRVHVRTNQLVIFGRPHGLLNLERNGEPETVRIYLGGVGEQRTIPNREEVGARHSRGYPRVPGGVGFPFGEPIPVRRFQAPTKHLVVQRLGPRPMERVVVVELVRLPRLA